MNPEAEPRMGARARQARSVARLAAVQALYQMEVAGAGAELVLREFTDHRFGAEMDGKTMAEADEAFFQEIVRGVVADQAAIDRSIVKRLATGWKLQRLDATVRAILRAGAWELASRPDVPMEVVIDEYVDLAKAFFDPTEAGFINAALDAISGDVRVARA